MGWGEKMVCREPWEVEGKYYDEATEVGRMTAGSCCFGGSTSV